MQTQPNHVLILTLTDSALYPTSLEMHVHIQTCMYYIDMYILHSTMVCTMEDLHVIPVYSCGVGML